MSCLSLCKVMIFRVSSFFANMTFMALPAIQAELLPYKIPAWIAGNAMKVMFAKNELTRKIMTLHNDKQDIFYCCQSVYQTGQELGVKMPILEANMKGISI